MSPDEQTAIVEVADALRRCWCRQMDLPEPLAWERLTSSEQLRWVELAHAAVSRWHVCSRVRLGLGR